MDYLSELERFIRYEKIDKSKIAEAINVSTHTLNNYISGRRQMKVEVYFNLCNAMKVSPLRFIDTPHDMELAGVDVTIKQHMTVLNKLNKCLEENIELKKRYEELEKKYSELEKVKSEK